MCPVRFLGGIAIMLDKISLDYRHSLQAYARIKPQRIHNRILPHETWFVLYEYIPVTNILSIPQIQYIL
jgi:hypothetical protein